MLATRQALRAFGASAPLCLGLLALSLTLAGLLPLRGGLIYTLAVDPSRHILIDLDRGTRTSFRVGDAQLALARDGRRAAYLMDRPVPEVVVPLLDGTSKIWATQGLYGMAWDKDGRRLLVSWQPMPETGLSRGLYWLSAENGDLSLLAANLRKHYGLRLSPDGRQAVSYAVQDGTGYDLFLIDLEDGSERALLATAADETSPSWSSDGQWIAYQHNEGGQSEVFVVSAVSAEGQQRRNLTRHPALDASPAWSPHGRWIAFSSNRAGSFQIYLLDVETETVEQVSDETLSALYPLWLP
ncbi:MAG: hypothetical protein NZ750_06330 [Anaerolineae bacterium]|nr:hypothetical protein [Anaerolineae bacterium]MDW8171700.1 hypothetical protein [Anaerolineae bacterium]